MFIKRLTPFVINEFCHSSYSLTGRTLSNSDLEKEMREVLDIGVANRTHIYIRSGLVWTSHGDDVSKPLFLSEEIRWVEVDPHISVVDETLVISELDDDDYWDTSRAFVNRRHGSVARVSEA